MPSAEQAISWSAHPARQRPSAAAFAGIVILAAAAAAWLSFGPAWALLALVLLIASLNRFFLPSRFEIDAEGITARHPLARQTLRWAEVRRFVHDRHGAYLSRRSAASRLDAFQGMHLVFGADRQEIMRAIRERIAMAGEQPAAASSVQSDPMPPVHPSPAGGRA